MQQVEDQITAWIAERPERQEQKVLFVQLVKALGFTYEECLESFIGTVMNAWKKDGRTWGELLASELDTFHKRIDYDDANGDPEKLAARADVDKIIDKQKAQLIELDE